MVLSSPSREPVADIQAQIEGVSSPVHPKLCAYIPPSCGVTAVIRPEGILLTSDVKRAERYRAAAILSDDDMAELLQYPQSKAEVEQLGDAVAVQARDEHDNVITEALTSGADPSKTISWITTHVPKNGCLAILTPEAAIARRNRINAHAAS